jgi:signal transduction histidine kinase
VRASSFRVIAVAVAAALALAAVGFAAEGLRFGWSDQSTAARLEDEVRGTVAARAREVQALARRVATEAPLVTSASTTPDGEAMLFARLTELTQGSDPDTVSATVYVPAGPSGAYRVLAWSDGPAEDLTPDTLAGPAGLFALPGTLGLRLVRVEPIEVAGRRVGVAAAETILLPVVHTGSSTGSYKLNTSFGPATLALYFRGAGQATPRQNAFLITTDGGPLLEVSFSTSDLGAERGMFRRRALAFAAVPLLLAILLLTGPVLDRRRASRTAAGFLAWSAIAGALMVIAAFVLIQLAHQVGAAPALDQAISGLAALGLVLLLLVSWWWRRPRRVPPVGAGARFGAEQIAAGVPVAAMLWLLARVLHDRINSASLDLWQFPLFPVDSGGLVYLAGLLLAQLALSWAAAMVLATIAARWRLGWRRPGMSLAAAVLWLVPTLVLLLLPHRTLPLPRASLMLVGATAALFALLSAWLRRIYRRTTQAMRLILVFGALLVPAILLYPVAWFYADGTARALIEDEYAPATAGHPQQLLTELGRAQDEIDRIPMSQLLPFVATGSTPGGAIPTQAAFFIWSQTSLSRSRVTSAIELYGADRALVSRFALNIPEYRTLTQNRKWSGTSCEWEVSWEAARFGAEDRSVLHAERGLCNAADQINGALVVQVVPDYRSLPFVSSASPYYDVLQLPDVTPRGSRLADLQVVVYGWSFHPLFASGRFAWPLPPAMVAQLSSSREPFWAELEAGGRTYHVHVGNDSGGIYALGYPTPTLFEHLTRLAEAATLTALLFVILLLGATLYVPFARSGPAPLRVLFDEIRTSFYRKLFLFFVLAAVGPVFMLALAFGAYMTGKFRADVESEATSVVTVARRVLEELLALQQHPDQPQATLTDDVMVWIGRVLDQDVNLFEGSDLAATSQRDLFASGLLPLRTPAGAYRAIALNRLPSYVAEDRLGTFRYLVAAAPVPARGRAAVLSVPLALRQREIDRQIDELNRGVLVGAVFVILFAAGLGASVAHRISDPVARLTRATRQIAAGQLDVRIVADTADELRRLVDDFNGMAATLTAQRAELARTNQLKAWAEMARQVAHEIKNPLTPIQLAAEHLQRVHDDQGHPLGPVVDQCVTTILRQVRLLRQIASEFSNFAGAPTPRFNAVSPCDLVDEVVRPYQAGLPAGLRIELDLADDLPAVWVDRTLAARALTNVVENALQAMPREGLLRIEGTADRATVAIRCIDTGVGMDAQALARAFEPYFSTKTAGSGLGLANAKRNIELCGGSMAIASAPGAGTTVTITLRREAPSAEPATG